VMPFFSAHALMAAIFGPPKVTPLLVRHCFNAARRVLRHEATARGHRVLS
jgi:hypothetical protein